MNKNYEEFIGELRLFLLNETGYTEDKIYFRKRERRWRKMETGYFWYVQKKMV